ncbi:hypothetical protein, partial [Xylella fastidiosa]|uniref:hypothetical protein n=1 Tax=Xylella fastidiosa TaxID=2371 RepID=UPI001EEA5BA1
GNFARQGVRRARKPRRGDFLGSLAGIAIGQAAGKRPMARGGICLFVFRGAAQVGDLLGHGAAGKLGAQRKS